MLGFLWERACVGAGLPAMAIGVYTARSFLVIGNEYISVAAVTAAIGSALTAGHFWKRAPKVTKRALAPPLGASPRLGMPAVRHCSVGPPRSAIHGRVAATPASCRGAHCAIPACGHRGLTGRLRSRSKARSKAEQQQQQCQSRGVKLHSPLWELACLRWRPKEHIRVSGIHLSSLTTIAGKPAPTGVPTRLDDQVGYQAASLCF